MYGYQGPWVWLIIIDFPQTLSLGRVGYGTTVGELSLISLRRSLGYGGYG